MLMVSMPLTSFQFTLPRGERLSRETLSSHTLKFQFTLPRGERPFINDPKRAPESVSIHAPARGATS